MFYVAFLSFLPHGFLSALCVFSILANLVGNIENEGHPSSNLLRDEALRLGFEAVGFVTAASSQSFERFQGWLERGCQAGMSYLADRSAARKHPDSILPGVRSLVMLGVAWKKVREGSPSVDFSGLSPAPGEPYGTIASYATGGDYHVWIRDRLKKLTALHRHLWPQGRARGVVDTAPLFEREFAAAAGLGVFGKNTMLIHPELGSRFYLAALLSTEDLSCENLNSSTPALPHPCGDCRACMDVCPSGALIEPYQLDARRCLNYWTIEHRGTIPREIAVLLGDSLFGCERCIDVCPWNRRTSQEASCKVRLASILEMDAEAFAERFGTTPLARAGLEGLQRTARLLLTNDC